jgi:hypothetical protein
MARQRLTRKLAEQQGKKASPPPQMPAVDRTEGPASPAYYPDPDADKYENGDTSSWAEDPHSPMEPESPPPAMPGNLTTEELDHPGTSEFSKSPESPEKAMEEGGGGGKKQASLKELAERRATLCVRLASAMMPKASALEVEEKAVSLMDLDDSKLKAAMEAFSVFAGEDKDEEFEEGEESEGTKEFDEQRDAGKKAAHDVTARLDKLESAFGRMVKAMSSFFGMEDDEDEGMSDKELMAYLMAEDMDGDGVDQNEADYGYSDKKSMDDDMEAMAMKHRMAEEEEEEMEEEEAMLRAMLEEMDEEMSVMASHAEDVTDGLAKGQDVQSGEGGNVHPDPAAHTPVVAQSDGGEKKASNAAENDIDIATGSDPMGLMDVTASADDELLALYADLDLPKTAGEEEEVEEEDEEEDEDDDAGTDEKAEKDDEEFGHDDEGKKASARQRPQPKRASAGAKTLGNVSGMPKAAHDEIAELGKLWETSPDVMSAFGLPSSK